MRPTEKAAMEPAKDLFLANFGVRCPYFLPKVDAAVSDQLSKNSEINAISLLKKGERKSQAQ